ncbi:hypothetical protein DDZ18_11985 [Marinicauda salina]|uniref:HTH tetR-type domain-containing protein n=1 Tax=Marinicauda salina TaxID=2135793 RepID=A0A2U2BR83_9PROT|nr:TetR/AcrR family transcriptional regulator [Marinicauda salina]PWE16488.1 hypothetical protein DDZ18_11985 [Marinicauda salina]
MSKSEDTRARILDTALAETARTGYAGLSIGHLAEAADMSKSGLFARFGGQDKLQVAIIEAASARFRADVIDPARKAHRARGRLEALAARWIGWLMDPRRGRPCPLLQAAFETPGLTAPAAETARQARRDWTAYLERLAGLAIREGDFRPDLKPARFAFAFEAAGLALHSYAAIQERDDAIELAEAEFARLFRAASA